MEYKALRIIGITLGGILLAYVGYMLFFNAENRLIADMNRVNVPGVISFAVVEGSNMQLFAIAKGEPTTMLQLKYENLEPGRLTRQKIESDLSQISEDKHNQNVRTNVITNTLSKSEIELMIYTSGLLRLSSGIFFKSVSLAIAIIMLITMFISGNKVISHIKPGLTCVLFSVLAVSPFILTHYATDSLHMVIQNVVDKNSME